MRKSFILLLCVVLIFSLCACRQKNMDYQEPVNFYYCNNNIAYNSATGVIQAEVREGSSFQGNLLAFLGAYLQGPVSSGLKRLIPANVYIVSCCQENDRVILVLSSQFSELSGMELTAACSALLKTIHDYTGAEILQISAKDAQLDDKNEIILSIHDFVFIDTAEQS